MKYNLKSKTILLSSLMLSLPFTKIYAKGHSGNGGDAYVCFTDSKYKNEVIGILKYNETTSFPKDPLGKSEDGSYLKDHIISVRLLDNYQSLYTPFYEESWSDPISDLQKSIPNDLLVKNKKRVYQNHRNFGEILDEWRNFEQKSLDRTSVAHKLSQLQNKIKWKINTNSIIEINDANSSIVPTEKCSILQLARHIKLSEDGYRVVNINETLYKLLPDVDKLTFLIHETLLASYENIEDTTQVRIQSSFLSSVEYFQLPADELENELRLNGGFQFPVDFHYSMDLKVPFSDIYQEFYLRPPRKGEVLNELNLAAGKIVQLQFFGKNLNLKVLENGYLENLSDQRIKIDALEFSLSRVLFKADTKIPKNLYFIGTNLSFDEYPNMKLPRKAKIRYTKYPDDIATNYSIYGTEFIHSPRDQKIYSIGDYQFRMRENLFLYTTEDGRLALNNISSSGNYAPLMIGTVKVKGTSLRCQPTKFYKDLSVAECLNLENTVFEGIRIPKSGNWYQYDAVSFYENGNLKSFYNHGSQIINNYKCVSGWVNLSKNQKLLSCKLAKDQVFSFADWKLYDATFSLNKYLGDKIIEIKFSKVKNSRGKKLRSFQFDGIPCQAKKSFAYYSETNKLAHCILGADLDIDHLLPEFLRNNLVAKMGGRIYFTPDGQIRGFKTKYSFRSDGLDFDRNSQIQIRNDRKFFWHKDRL
ncbi:MAG: hypothetical protein VX642_07345 [Bdellovibrionota bacterium]|nr:hypothetical protein [Bdellovibrionota bacterium]